MKREILKKIMELDNEKADKYLAVFSNELKQKIFVATNNDEIFNNLELLEEFIYKAQERTIEVLSIVIDKHNPATEYKSEIGIYSGKDYEQVIQKVISLLAKLRYYRTQDVLNLLLKLTQDKNQTIKNAALDLVKRLSRYDFTILTKTKLGYSIQVKVFEFISALSQQAKIKNLDFVTTIAEELLKSSFEGSTASAVDTLTIHFGAVQPTPFLKTLRHKVIDFVFDLYQQVEGDSQKVKLVRVLEEAIRGPMHGDYSEGLQDMIIEDAQYLVEIYRKMLFDSSNKLMGSMAVVEEVEKVLYWFYQEGKLNTSEARKFKDDIQADPFYSIFRLFAGDPAVFRDEREWNKGEEKRKTKIDAIFEQINKDNLGEWEAILNKIAKEYGSVEEWQFGHFRQFLERLAADKSEFATEMLINAIKEEKPVKKIALNILIGLRYGNRFDLWDKLVEEIVNYKDKILVGAIAGSLYSIGDKEEVSMHIRKEDLAILSDIVLGQNKFKFLSDYQPKDWSMGYAIFNALLRNFAFDPKYIEGLIITILKENSKWKHFQVRELAFATHQGWFSLSDFSKEGIDFLKTWFVELGNLDWDSQEALLSLGKKDVEIILDVIWARIKRDADSKSGSDFSIEKDRYEAIPYHFNETLAKYLAESPIFLDKINPWLENVTGDWSAFNWSISRFLERIGDVLPKVLYSLVELGGDENLAKAVQLMDRFENMTDYDLCMKIAEKTNNKKILSGLDAAIYSTGVVSGDEGLADAYDDKIKILKQYLVHENEGVRLFTERLISSLEASSKAERQRAQEDRKLRQIEFEN